MTTTDNPTPKAKNGEHVPRVFEITEAAPNELAAFEREYQLMARSAAPWPRSDKIQTLGEASRKGGRDYLAIGWAMARKLTQRGRKRKGPGECHLTGCKCACHPRNARAAQPQAESEVVTKLRAELRAAKEFIASVTDADGYPLNGLG